MGSQCLEIARNHRLCAGAETYEKRIKLLGEVVNSFVQVCPDKHTWLFATAPDVDCPLCEIESRDRSVAELEAQLEASDQHNKILTESNREMMEQLEGVRKVVPILEDTGYYSDCGCGTRNAKLVKKALNGEDGE